MTDGSSPGGVATCGGLLTNVEVRSRARAAFAQTSAAYERARHYYDVLLPIRQQVLEQTQLQYNAMQIGAFQLLVAKQQQIETAAAAIDGLRDYWLARAELDQLMNGAMPSRRDAGAAENMRSLAAPRNEGDH